MVKITYEHQEKPCNSVNFKPGHIYKNDMAIHSDGLYMCGKYKEGGFLYLVNLSSGFMHPTNQFNVEYMDITDKVSLSVPLIRVDIWDDTCLKVGETYISCQGLQYDIEPFLVSYILDPMSSPDAEDPTKILYKLNMFTGVIEVLKCTDLEFAFDEGNDLAFAKKCNIEISIN